MTLAALCCCWLMLQGAPTWFNMLYRLIRPQLSPSTRAKVQVCAKHAKTARTGSAHEVYVGLLVAYCP